MSHFLKSTGFLLAALILLGSCSSPNIEIHEYGLRGAEKTYVMYSPQPVTEKTPEVTAHIEAVELPDKTVVAAAVPVSSVTSAFSDPDTTVVPEQYVSPAASANSSMNAGSANTKVYTYETQATNGTLNILGPNLVYVGESFDLGYTYPAENENTDILWTCLGSGGRIDKSGVFSAVSRCTCTVIATDRNTNVYAAMKIHCIEPGDDVDFIPLVNGIPIANKTYPLPKDYDPGLDTYTRAAFLKMQAAAKEEDLSLCAISAYRSYNYQKQVYAGWVNIYGSDADLVSARPGYSEHQLGLAIDVNSVEYSFENTPEGKWLKQHCADYGFIIRYPSYDSKRTTGYSYEPWHIRYVGKSLARTITDSGKTLEELLGIDSYYR